LLPSSTGFGPRDETLSQRLSPGALPLPFALQCATDIAAALRDLHEDGRVHGSLDAQSILLTPNGATLLEPANRVRRVTFADDIVAFGAVLYQMVTGHEPLPGRPLPAPSNERAETGPSGIRAATMRLAARCMRVNDPPLKMKLVLAELQPLYTLARQAASGPEEFVDPPPAGPAQPPTRSTDPIAWKNFEVDKTLPDNTRVDEVCPSCGGTYVYLSKPRSRFERFLVWFDMPLHRCHRCYHRYFLVFGVSVSKGALLDDAGKFQ
jgi:serine/threonine protein kinase